MKKKIYFYIKKNYLLILFFNLSYCPDGDNGNFSSRTILSNPVPFFACSPQRIDIMPNLLQSDKNFGIFVNFEYMSSTNDNAIGQYFLPNGNTNIFAKGGPDYFTPASFSKKKRDLDSLVFNINYDPFESVLSLIPSSSIFYTGLFGYYILDKNEDETPKLSLQVAMPIVSEKHTIYAYESIKNPNSKTDKLLIEDYKKSPIKSILEGLSRNELKHSKWLFYPCSMSTTRISDVEINFAFNNVPCSVVSTEGFLGVIIPTSNKLSNLNSSYEKNIFEPIAGYSSSLGFQYGTIVNVFVYKNEERDFKLILGANLIYMLPHEEYRTFDLVNRPWSRYLPAYVNFKNSKQQITPLANLLTLRSRITPNFTIVSTTEVDYTHDIYSLGIGYTMYARQSESVTILDEIPNIVLVPGIKDLTTEPNKISIVRDISLRLNEEDVEILDDPKTDQSYYLSIIRPADISKASATQPALLTGTLYGKVSILLEDLNLKIGLGGSYRFTHNNAAIQYASVWGWLQFDF